MMRSGAPGRHGASPVVSLSRNLLDQQQEEFSSDEGEEEEFVPTKTELREEEEQEEFDSGQEEEEQEEVTRRGQRTPRSQQKNKKKSRTPSRRVSPSPFHSHPGLTSCSDEIHLLVFCRSNQEPLAPLAPLAMPLPASLAGPSQSGSQQTSWRRPGAGERRTRTRRSSSSSSKSSGFYSRSGAT